MKVRPAHRIRLAVALAVLTVPLLLVSSAHGGVSVTCTLVPAGPSGPAGDVLKVVDRVSSVTHIYREGDEVVVFNNRDSEQTTCAGGTPTVFNIDRIEYSTATGVPFFNYLGAGALAPGASPEAGAAEIEISIEESYSPKVLNVAGGDASERIEVGQLGRKAVGINLDAQADGAAQDADFTVAAPNAEISLRVVAKGGNDTVSALGGPAFTGPIAAERLTLTGGPGDDRLLGGAGKDSLNGEDGNDLLLGGRGRDNLSIGHGRDVAKGGKGADQISNRDWASADDLGPDRVFGGAGDDNINVAQVLAGDRVDCGAGRDRLAIDPGDLTKACEDVDTLHIHPSRPGSQRG